MNPHKWKKYSLLDTDTSDRTNTAAAFEFLKEIETRKLTEEEEAEEEDNYSSAVGNAQMANKIIFKNRKRTSPSATFNSSVSLKSAVEVEAPVDKAVLKGSKVVMPEYVIGQKVTKVKKAKTGSGTNKNQEKILKLGHLFEEEDEDA